MSEQDFNKTVSIIIPFHLRLKKLEKLIKSINKLNYSSKLIEIILIADGTKIDQSKIKSVSKFQIKFIINKHNKGVSFSRNAGIKYSNHNYLWFLDADTEIVSHYTLNNMFKQIEENSIDAITGYCENFEGETYVQIPLNYPNMIVIEKFVKKKEFKDCFVNMAAMSSVFINKEKFISKYGFFDERLVIKEDEELFFRSGIKNNSFLISENCLVKHNPETKNNKNVFDHILDVIDLRSYTFKKHNKLKLLLIYDLLFMPIIIFKLCFNKEITSRRASVMVIKMSANKIILILFRLFKSYFNLDDNKIKNRK